MKAPQSFKEVVIKDFLQQRNTVEKIHTSGRILGLVMPWILLSHLTGLVGPHHVNLSTKKKKIT